MTPQRPAPPRNEEDTPQADGQRPYIDISRSARHAGIAAPVLASPALIAAVVDYVKSRPDGNEQLDPLCDVLVPLRWLSGRMKDQTRIQFGMGRGEGQVSILARYQTRDDQGDCWTLDLVD